MTTKVNVWDEIRAERYAAKRVLLNSHQISKLYLTAVENKDTSMAQTDRQLLLAENNEVKSRFMGYFKAALNENITCKAD